MTARELFGTLLPPFSDRTITSVTERAEQATADSIFVCISGSRADGHDFAPTAYRNGCRFFIAERMPALPSDAFVQIVPDSRAALASLACRVSGDPSRRLFVIGITGTKGKTTTAHLLFEILNRCKIPTGYIGTNGILYGEVEQSTRNTTPDAVTLQSTFSDMADVGMRAVILEVSSQALMQHRVTGTHFEAVLYTNLFPDHIGVSEHPSFEHYRDSKHRLFTEFDARYAFFNIDDSTAPLMMTGARAERICTCGSSPDADYRLSSIHPTRTSDALGVSFTVSSRDTVTPVTLPLIGAPNASNAALAFSAARELFGLSEERIAGALEDSHVAGRSESILLPNGAAAVIDYAHNGESLRQILLALRPYTKGRLIALFGSVGERSHMRRADLGGAAARYADLAILTSDNPAEEDPNAIMEEISRAFAGFATPYIKIPDRASAIREAVSIASPGDILLLAGKGHETYQLIGREKLPFCERELLLSAIRDLPTFLQI